MRTTRRSVLDVFDNPVLVGTVTILIVMVAVYLSYVAENGLPFVPTYSVKVQVANAGELVKNADVRIGGARVGQVLTITPELADKQYPQPYAQLGLSLQKSLEPLPANTKYQVRLSSVLGGQYLELIPGTETGPHPATVPDGGTLTLTDNLKTSHNIPYVDLSTAFGTFGPKTQAGIRSAAGQLGDAVAGRGSDFNDTIYNTRLLIGPLDNLLKLIARPSTNLSGFVTGLAATTAALAPVAPTVSSLLADGATTFNALQRADLGQTIDQLPPTETVATNVLNNARPVLSNAATIIQDLRPGAALLPSTAQRLEVLLRAAPPVFRALPAVASGIRQALGATRKLADDPAATQAFQVLGSNDLGTTGASAFVGIGAILAAVAPEQFACNIAGTWISNFASALSEGNNVSGWLRISPVIDAAQLTEAAKPASDLHADYYPIEDSQECQAGNEVYTGKQSLGNPGTTSGFDPATQSTSPPAGVLALGRKVGLVP
jgi:virulence factor Mce-like protein